MNETLFYIARISAMEDQLETARRVNNELCALAEARKQELSIARLQLSRLDAELRIVEADYAKLLVERTLNLQTP